MLLVLDFIRFISFLNLSHPFRRLQDVSTEHLVEVVTFINNVNSWALLWASYECYDLGIIFGLQLRCLWCLLFPALLRAKDIRWTHAILIYHWLANTEPLSSQRQVFQQKSEDLFQGIRRVEKYSTLVNAHTREIWLSRAPVPCSEHYPNDQTSPSVGMFNDVQPIFGRLRPIAMCHMGQ